MKKINLFFLTILVVLFSLGQLQRIEFLNWPAFYVHDLLTAAWFTFLFISFGLSKCVHVIADKINFLNKKNVLFLFFWIGAGWLVAIVNNQFNPIALLYFARFFVYGWLFLLLKKYSKVSNLQWQATFFATGLLVLLFGAIQYLFFPDSRALLLWGWDEHYFRMIGTQFDPNYLGILFLILFLNLEKLTVLKQKWVKSVLQIATVIGLSLTFSRASYLGFILSIVVTGINKHRQILFTAWLILLILVIPKPGGEGVDLLRTSTIESRVVSSQQLTQSLQIHEIVLGRGLFNSTQPIAVTTFPNHAYLADNLVILIFNSLGIVGLFVVLMLVAKILWYFYQHDQIQFATILAVLIHSMFNNTLFQPFVFIYMAWSLMLGNRFKKQAA